MFRRDSSDQQSCGCEKSATPLGNVLPISFGHLFLFSPVWESPRSALVLVQQRGLTWVQKAISRKRLELNTTTWKEQQASLPTRGPFPSPCSWLDSSPWDYDGRVAAASALQGLTVNPWALSLDPSRSFIGRSSTVVTLIPKTGKSW